MLRSLNLRRLSYVVYTGEKNQFLAQLPSIQEKLVEILRNTVVSPTVHSEVSGLGIMRSSKLIIRQFRRFTFAFACCCVDYLHKT
jgi:hypothetical protein